MTGFRSVTLTALTFLVSAANALACDFGFPKRGSVVRWPDELVAAEINVLSLRRNSEFDGYARVRLVRPLRGEVPPEFRVHYEIGNTCGSHFTKGETRVAGLRLLPRSEWKKGYRFSVDSIAETWAQAVFVDRTLTLAE
jgi:hypothetical protein